LSAEFCPELGGAVRELRAGALENLDGDQVVREDQTVADMVGQKIEREELRQLRNFKAPSPKF
jgi:hypothetical protein